MTIIFILGIRDDISSLYANQKFIYQLLAAFLAVYFADIRLIGLYGVFGIGEMNELLSGLFSMFVIIGLINAFNLIDGIDGLAGSVALVNSIVFGVYFYLLGHVFFLYVSMVLAGAIIAFLLFNWHPSKIFMGDTGSLLIGYILISMAIVFINQNVVQPVTTTSVSLSFALLIIPVYDTIRVILLRLSQGRSPFYPDKKHIHHILLKQGFNHSQSTLILVTFNMLVVLFVFQFDFLGDTTLLLSIGILSFLFGLFFDLRLIRVMKNDKKRARENQTLHISKSA
ncbi:MAG: undecaprenyl/decaprenyl-phosphate alpha-N-acetylglucosaminyl 1-phosphate transferase [Cyclobacteriaceae bacterium]|nr:undecaprenyl/decaprenyl-phosphate alpha-N-acetylglucosaminyl 1-phosphate transferase [Cyclobacteriaceae bacterium]